VTSSSLVSVTAVLLILEWIAWLALVPAAMEAQTFVQWNALTIGMFVTGFGIAAKGLPTRSVAEVLYHVEHPSRRARRD
jgi:hypothetical protein